MSERRAAVYCIAEIITASPMEFDLFKIGVTGNLKARLRELQTGNPRQLAPVLVNWFRSREDALAVERKAHLYLSGHGQVGEWFSAMNGGCPYESLFMAASSVTRYVPASELYFDHIGPDWDTHLLRSPIVFAGSDLRPELRRT